MTKVLYWFRTDLRLHDSPAFHKALTLKPSALYPVWCWDPHYVYEQKVGPNRWQFLLDSMQDVSDSLTKINAKSQLFVVRAPPTTILPVLCKEWGITDIVWEKDDDEYTKVRDSAVSTTLKAAGVNVHIVLGHTLYDSDLIIAKAKGTCPTSYGTFCKLVGTFPAPAQPLPIPTSIPSPGTTKILSLSRKEHSVESHRKNDVNLETRETGTSERDQSYENFMGPKGKWEVPTMEELGMKATSSIRGGEMKALEVLEAYLEDEQRVAMFQKPKTSPAMFEPASTTVLSPHMKFGTLSCRLFYHRVQAINQKFKAHSNPPESLVGQLLWREFFHANQASTPNFVQIRGNAVSRYIPWKLQTRYKEDGTFLPREETEEVWKKEEPEAWGHYEAWREGRTGFPWIDALMRQLRENGWMHHLGRHSVACFLTRGHLYISWERGAEVFDTFLVDWDPALNSGNWMWLSASAFFSQYFRVYSPATYGQKSDPTGALIRRYVPELANFPDKYIYEPWKAPLMVQKEAKCVLGIDYPKRIIDDKEAKDNALRGMKAAYTAGLHGNDAKVFDGTAEAYVKALESAKVKLEEKTASPAKRKAAQDKIGGSKQTKLNFPKTEENPEA